MMRFMKPGLAMVGAALAVVLLSTPAMSASITVNFAAFNGNGPGDIGISQSVGTGLYSIPAGESIISAIFSSTFGNSTVPNTAIMSVFVDGILMGQCASKLDPCWVAQIPTPFEYTFASAEFPTLGDGAALLTILQTDTETIRLGASLLRIETAPSDLTPTPEPASLTLMAIGLTGAASAAWRRRKRARPDA